MIANVKTEIPGPKSKELLDLSDKYEPKCMTQQAPLVWEKAEGVKITDVDGNSYIDMTSGVLVTNVGHCHPKHVKAIQDAVANLMNCYDFPTPARVRFSQKLVEKMPPNLDKAFLVTTGSEATEAAMRVAKRYTGKHEIVSFYGAFHGRTYGAMSMCGKTGSRRKFGPMMPGVIHVPYPYCYRCPFKMEPESCGLHCLEFIDVALNAQSTGDVAALIIEPYQGAAGFVFPPEGYLKKLEQWCRSKNILLIFDEVQSSFGRTGTMFAHEWEGNRPNMLCLGKGIGSGIPTAAVMAESGLMAALAPGEMSSTTGGNPISCAAGLAILEIMETEHLVENSRAIGLLMKKRFQAMAARSSRLGDVRGRGLVMGLEFVEDKETKVPSEKITMEFIDRSVRKGVVLGRVGIYGNVVRIAPPLVINEEEASEALDIMEKALIEMEN